MTSTGKDTGIRALGVVIWLASVLFYLYEFILQVSPGVLLKPWMAEFGISATRASHIGSIYFYSYALMQLPAGMLLDRFGPRKILSIAALLCTLGTLLISFTTSFNVILFARFMTALGSATAMVGSMKIVSNWFDSRHFALFSGLILFVGMMGAVSAKVPLVMAVNAFGWRDTLLYLGFFGAVITLLMIVIVRDEPSSHSIEKDYEKHSMKSLIRVFKSPQTWLVAIYGGLMLTPVLSIGELWGEKYLADAYNYSHVESAAALTFIFIGLGIGAPIGGWLSEYFDSRKLTMVIAPIGSLLCLLLYIYISHAIHIYYYILGFLVGLFTAFSWTAFAFARELHPHKDSGTVCAFVNLGNMLLGATGQILIGVILDIIWEGTSINNIQVHTERNYEIAFSIFPIFVFIALILTYFLKEKKIIAHTH